MADVATGLKGIAPLTLGQPDKAKEIEERLSSVSGGRERRRDGGTDGGTMDGAGPPEG
jgi:hypothetical protein